jgi:hypothetical protein
MVNTLQECIDSEKKTHRHLGVRRHDVIRTAVRTAEFPAEELCPPVCVLHFLQIARGHRAFIGADDFGRWARAAQSAAIEPDDAMTEASNLVELVADKNDGATCTGCVVHLPETLFLELDVTHSQDLVNEEDFGFQIRGNREG